MNRRLLLGIAGGLTMLSLLGLIGAWAVYWTVASRAQLVQRVEPYDETTANLLGQPGLPVGEPERIILDDPEAFLPGVGPRGEALVNEAYLRENGIRPVRLEAARSSRNRASAVAGLGIVLFGGLWIYLARKR